MLDVFVAFGWLWQARLDVCHVVRRNRIVLGRATDTRIPVLSAFFQRMRSNAAGWAVMGEGACVGSPHECELTS